jgi:hypothetical protein
VKTEIYSHEKPNELCHFGDNRGMARFGYAIEGKVNKKE